jgi:PAS domain-containing protein
MVDWTSGAITSANSLLQALLTSSGDCIGILDLDGNLLSVTESGQRVMEVTDFSAIKGRPWQELWGDRGDSDARAAIETAHAGKIGRFQKFATTSAGTSKWWDVTVNLVRDSEGQPDKLLAGGWVTAVELCGEAVE